MLTQMRKSAQSNPIFLLILLIAVALVFSLAITPAIADASYYCPAFNYDCPDDGCCLPCGECEVCDPEAHLPVVVAPPPPPAGTATVCDTCSRNPCTCCDDCGYSPCGCAVVTEAPPTAAAATPRDPNAGPRTGDDLGNNWFVQIAGISLLVAALAIAGLISTGRKGRLDKNRVYHLRT